MTAADVARLAGVSQPVVSTVLNGGKGNVGASEATRERVLKAASKLGYRINVAARAMRTGHFSCAALLLSTDQITSQLPSQLFHGLVDALAATGMHMTVAKIEDARLVDEEVVSGLLSDLFADGFLINYNAKIPPATKELIERYHMPSVWLNSKHDFDCVYPDDFGAAYQLTNTFINEGHRRIAYVNFRGRWHYSGVDRYQGYVEAMVAAGLTPQAVEVQDAIREEGLEIVAKMLAEPNRVTAIIGYTPGECEWACQAAEKAGLTAPGDLMVGSISARPMEWRRTPVPTMLLPHREIAKAAVAMLLKRIANPAEHQPAEAVPCHLAGSEDCSADRAPMS